jgi:hypothetical protein
MFVSLDKTWEKNGVSYRALATMVIFLYSLDTSMDIYMISNYELYNEVSTIHGVYSILCIVVITI